VPALIYSLSSPTLLLLDQFHQAVPFADLVLAVHSRAPAAKLDEQCDGMPVELRSERIERPLLASLLQTGFQVAPVDVSWSSAHNTSQPNLLWAAGLTPFGPYSTRLELSFAHRDAASRAVVHAAASEALSQLRDLKDFFSEFGKEVDDVLNAAEHLPFLRRLNVFAFKLERARSYLSLHNFKYARYYIASTQHDLSAMRGILEKAGRSFTSHLVCPDA